MYLRRVIDLDFQSLHRQIILYEMRPFDDGYRITIKQLVPSEILITVCQSIDIQMIQWYSSFVLFKIVNVGLLTVRVIPRPRASACVNVVLPAPRSPSSVSTSGGVRRAASFVAISSVSFTEFPRRRSPPPRAEVGHAKLRHDESGWIEAQRVAI